jgi:hypothetical protein
MARHDRRPEKSLRINPQERAKHAYPHGGHNSVPTPPTSTWRGTTGRGENPRSKPNPSRQNTSKPQLRSTIVGGRRGSSTEIERRQHSRGAGKGEKGRGGGEGIRYLARRGYSGRKKAVARVGLGPVGRGWDRRRLYFGFHDELCVSPRLLRDEREKGTSGRKGGRRGEDRNNDGPIRARSAFVLT